ncbi:MAG: T9SS type A sorting domain-containing protein [Bacteroidota bacterium]
MKRIYFLSGLILLLTWAAQGQTLHSGNVSGIWYAGSNPHVISGDVVVPPDSLLTLEAGVEVRFDGHYKFLVHGTLRAIGTPADSIIFTRNRPADDSRGWGIRFDSSSADTNILRYCRIEHGYAIDTIGSSGYSDIGGGVFCFNANLIIENCHITHNTASTGGGIYIFNFLDYPVPKFVYIRSNLIDSNSTISKSYNACGGGGINVEGGQVTIERNLIIGNTYSGNDANYEGGGGIFVSNATVFGPVQILNNTIYGNSSPKGAGIHTSRGFDGVIENNIIWRNRGSVNNDQITIETDYDPKPIPAGLIINYNDIQDSAIVVVYRNDRQDTAYSWLKNISAYPGFADTASYNFNLMEGSPCIDAGDPTSVHDPDNTIADIGAFYFWHINGIQESYQTPKYFSLEQNYPNPFNPSTNIRFSLPKASDVNLSIYNILGERIAVVVSEHMNAGTHLAEWNASGFASGVYFYRLSAFPLESRDRQAGSFNETRKLILLK